MLLYKNNTGQFARKGMIAVADPKKAGFFVYAQNNPKDVLGIVGNTVARDGSTELFVSKEECDVYTADTVRYGDIVRARKIGDKGTAGMAVRVTDADKEYLQIGTVISKIGRGLMRVRLDIYYVNNVDSLVSARQDGSQIIFESKDGEDTTITVDGNIKALKLAVIGL